MKIDRFGAHNIAVVIWTLLPWLFISAGLHFFKSILWSFFLYHCCCLLPLIIWKRKTWLPHMVPPTVLQAAAIVAAGLALGLLTAILHHWIGSFVLLRELALTAMTSRGFQPAWLLPISIYFITINPIVEELFWRGVVLNDLCRSDTKLWSAPCIWTNLSFAAWHILVVKLFVHPFFNILAVVIVAAVGFFLSWLYRKTGSVVVPMLWHGLVFDLAVVVLLWLIV